MAVSKINLNGIHELDLDLGIPLTLSVNQGVVSITGVAGGSTTHSESLTDGNGNFIFAATLTSGGDVITVIGVPN